MVEVVVAQYYIPNQAEVGHIIFALKKLGKLPFTEVVMGGKTLGFYFRFSMPRAVQADLEKIFEQPIDLEQFRYEPTGPISITEPAPIEGASAVD